MAMPLPVRLSGHQQGGKIAVPVSLKTPGHTQKGTEGAGRYPGTAWMVKERCMKFRPGSMTISFLLPLPITLKRCQEVLFLVLCFLFRAKA